MLEPFVISAIFARLSVIKRFKVNERTYISVGGLRRPLMFSGEANHKVGEKCRKAEDRGSKVY
jgi:hypothetical protein